MGTARVAERDDLSVVNALLACPACHQPLRGTSSRLRCEPCRRTFDGIDGSFDFTDLSGAGADEQRHYEGMYDRREAAAKPFDAAAASSRWHDRQWPECEIILRRLGPVAGKVILALGNGSSPKELYLVDRGALLIHSDLSVNGPRAARAATELGPLAPRVAFHAIDAYHLPFADESIDVVYGFEFVHHLPDLPAFFAEAARVLKPGGLCVFFDHAYSPIWQKAKLTVLSPLMKLVHRVRGISPEDLRFTYAGGFRAESLAQLAAAHGLVRPFFDRTTFFQYILVNGFGKLAGWEWPLWCYRVPGTIGYWLDAVLTSRSRWLDQSRIEMVWGFAKPEHP